MIISFINPRRLLSCLLFCAFLEFKQGVVNITIQIPKIQMQELTDSPAKSNGRWTHEEHLLFLEGLRLHGKNWKKIEQHLKTRSGAQIRSHAQKFFLKMKPSTSSEHQDPSSTCELQEAQEDATMNSKSQLESPSETDDSYFLSKIIEYSNSKQCLDFWQGLVDCKSGGISKENQGYKINSFMIYEGGERLASSGCRSGTIQA